MAAFEETIRALESNASVANMQAVVDAVTAGCVTDADLASLSSTLARSGEQKRFPSNVHTADIASTGGPSSLSTLLGPLYLRALGFHVPKLGVPGRPAGGI